MALSFAIYEAIGIGGSNVLVGVTPSLSAQAMANLPKPKRREPLPKDPSQQLIRREVGGRPKCPGKPPADRGSRIAV